MSFDFEECLRLNLLRKIPPSRERAFQSIEKAKEWAVEAEASLRAKAFNSSLHASYMVMFHAGRALLFFEGYREKSHACIARFLERKYVSTGKLDQKWVDILDHNRELRHHGQYDLSYISTEDEVRNSLDAAGDFLSAMESLLKSL